MYLVKSDWKSYLIILSVLLPMLISLLWLLECFNCLLFLSFDDTKLFKKLQNRLVKMAKSNDTISSHYSWRNQRKEHSCWNKQKKKNSFEESLNHFKCGVYLKYFISFCLLKDASYLPIDLYKEILWQIQGYNKPWVSEWL